MDAFLSSLDAGFIDVRNPFNAASVRRVSLAPEDVDCLVFWTRDPRALVANLDRLGGLRDRFFVHVTVTGYPRALEPGVAPTDAAIAAVEALAARIGRERIAWRYDPVILAGPLDRAFHIANFSRLAEVLAASVSRIVLSLLDEYATTRGRLERAGFDSALFGSPRGIASETGSPAFGTVSGSRRPSPSEPWPELLVSLASIAASHGLAVGACAEPFDLAPYGIAASPCVDGAELARLFGFATSANRDGGQRKACLCAPSVDVGEYGACPASCVYCYARR